MVFQFTYESRVQDNQKKLDYVFIEVCRNSKLLYDRWYLDQEEFNLVETRLYGYFQLFQREVDAWVGVSYGDIDVCLFLSVFRVEWQGLEGVVSFYQIGYYILWGENVEVEIFSFRWCDFKSFFLLGRDIFFIFCVLYYTL